MYLKELEVEGDSEVDVKLIVVFIRDVCVGGWVDVNCVEHSRVQSSTAVTNIYQQEMKLTECT